MSSGQPCRLASARASWSVGVGRSIIPASIAAIPDLTNPATRIAARCRGSSFHCIPWSPASPATNEPRARWQPRSTKRSIPTTPSVPPSPTTTAAGRWRSISASSPTRLRCAAWCGSPRATPRPRRCSSRRSPRPTGWGSLAALAPVRAGRSWSTAATTATTARRSRRNIHNGNRGRARLRHRPPRHRPRLLAGARRSGQAARFRNVLDIGTGSGVLAIAAAKLMRVPVTGSDIDWRAVEAARGNVRLNGVAPTSPPCTPPARGVR